MKTINLMAQIKVVPKKNSRIVIPRRTRNGIRCLSIPNSRYTKFEKEFATLLLGQYKGEPIDYPIAIDINITVKDKRRGDLDNLVTSVLDALEKARIIDNDKLILKINAQLFKGDMPKVEIKITRLDYEI